MNHAHGRVTTGGHTMRALLVGALALCAGACREGRNGLGAAPPSGAGGGVVVGAPPAPGAAGPASPATPGADGPSLGIVLLSKQPRYKLRGGEDRIAARVHDLQTGADAPARPGGKKHPPKSEREAADQGLPEAPQVDMTLRIINRSKQRVDFWSDGDPVTVTLRLEGAGAVTAPLPVMHTMEMRPPKVVTLGPGETFDVVITKLEFGERGDSIRAYWTRPGDYSIVPSLETAVRPAWPGTSVDGEGFGRVMLAGPPLRVHVDPR